VNYQPGTYLITSPAHWTKSGASILIIKRVDSEEDVVVYSYLDDEDHYYRRDFFDFCSIEIVPITSLTAVLI
jgi:hypothetical protein